jgi:hypothetical protein
MHPHLLRHACASHLLNNGCSLDVIADLLGHDNLDITAHYAQVSTRLMMDTYRSARKKSIPKKGVQVCASLHALSWVSSLSPAWQIQWGEAECPKDELPS